MKSWLEENCCTVHWMNNCALNSKSALLLALVHMREPISWTTWFCFQLCCFQKAS